MNKPSDIPFEYTTVNPRKFRPGVNLRSGGRKINGHAMSLAKSMMTTLGYHQNRDFRFLIPYPFDQILVQFDESFSSSDELGIIMTWERAVLQLGDLNER